MFEYIETLFENVTLVWEKKGRRTKGFPLFEKVSDFKCCLPDAWCTYVWACVHLSAFIPACVCVSGRVEIGGTIHISSYYLVERIADRRY